MVRVCFSRGADRFRLGGSLAIVPFLGVVYHCYSGKGNMNCDELKTSILGWFGSEIECQPSSDNSLVATFPLLRLNGDAIEIGISPVGENRWRLSDLGETHSTFFLADLGFHDDYVRSEELNQILVAHRLTDIDQEISTETTSEELADRVFDFLHALQSMSGLQYTAKPRKETRDFNTVVAMFFAQHGALIEIPPDPVEGRGGSWKFDFSLNHVKKETLLKTISTIGKNAITPLAERATFEIFDVQKLRPETKAVVIGDDRGKDRETLWRPDVLRLFREYEVPFYAFVANNDSLVELAQQYSVSGT